MQSLFIWVIYNILYAVKIYKHKKRKKKKKKKEMIRYDEAFVKQLFFQHFSFTVHNYMNKMQLHSI